MSNLFLEKSLKQKIKYDIIVMQTFYKGGQKMSKKNKIDKSKLFVRIMAVILAGLMILSVAATLIYCLV